MQVQKQPTKKDPRVKVKKGPKRFVWKAEDYVRPDWDVDHVIERLEERAKGYDGLLRSLLCTAAAQLRKSAETLDAMQDEMRVQGELADMALEEAHGSD